MRRCFSNTNKLKLVSIFLISFCWVSILYPITNIEFLSRRLKAPSLEYLLKYFSPERISEIESNRKFVIHSGPSGVGQGTIKDRMLELFPGKFKRFLLYATRERRGIKFSSDSPVIPLIKKYIKMAQNGREPRDMEEILANLSDEERNKLTERDIEEVEGLLFVDWEEILEVAPREDIPSLEERFQMLEDGGIMAYKEFNGIHYWFVSQEEIFALRDEKGIIIEPVRDYYQGLDISKIRDTFRKGSDRIYILEGDRVWFDHVNKYFPKDSPEAVTSIFISAISEEEFKTRMAKRLGITIQELDEKLLEWFSGRYVSVEEGEATIFDLLLRGGIEKYIKEVEESLIELPDDLTPKQNKSFLNIRNAILATTGYKILHPEATIQDWLKKTKLVSDDDLRQFNAKLEKGFTLSTIAEIANKVYEKIKENELVLTAMAVVIEEMVFRIENRIMMQGKDPKDYSALGNTYARASQSPREYGGSSDYEEMIVNTWGELDESATDLTGMILEKLYQNISP